MLKSKLTVLTLTSIGMFKYSVDDDVFGHRISSSFDVIIRKVSGFIATIKLPEFFDFIVDFVYTHYTNFTSEDLQIMLESLVKRIIKE